MHAHDRTYLARLGFADPDKGDARHDLACQYLSRPEILARIGEMFVRPVAEKLAAIGPGKTFVGETKVEKINISKITNECHLKKGEGQYATTVGFLDVDTCFAATAVFSGREQHTVCINRFFVDNKMIDISREEFDSRWEEFREYQRTSNRVQYGNPGYSVHVDRGYELRGRLPREGLVNESRWREARNSWEIRCSIVFEVKIGPTSSAEIIRQIGLYRDFYPDGHSPAIIWCVVTAFPITGPDRESFRRAGIVHLRLSPAFDAWCAEQEAARDDPAADVTI